MDDETNWQRQVLIGLVVLVAVGALIGGIVAFVSIKAADFAGIDDTPAPNGPPAGGRGNGGGPTGGSTSEAPSTDATTPSEQTTPTPSETSTTREESGIVLEASPRSVGTYERINLTGTYKAPSGTVLQVQRREGGSWVDFPTTATVANGSFTTYVETGQTGLNRFRMLAIGRDDTSNTVRVRVS